MAVGLIVIIAGSAQYCRISEPRQRNQPKLISAHRKRPEQNNNGFNALAAEHAWRDRARRAGQKTRAPYSGRGWWLVVSALLAYGAPAVSAKTNISV